MKEAEYLFLSKLEHEEALSQELEWSAWLDEYEAQEVAEPRLHELLSLFRAELADRGEESPELAAAIWRFEGECFGSAQPRFEIFPTRNTEKRLVVRLTAAIRAAEKVQHDAAAALEARRQEATARVLLSFLLFCARRGRKSEYVFSASRCGNCDRPFVDASRAQKRRFCSERCRLRAFRAR